MKEMSGGPGTQSCPDPRSMMEAAGASGTISDDMLVARVAAGDAAACRELAGRHLGRIVAFAYRMVGNHADAEDIAQEVFVRLWRHAARWQPEGARLTTWLHRVARNLCHDRYARRREQALDDVREPADTRPSPAERLQAEDLARCVNDALATLPERQRSAITLVHYQGFGNAETADIMEVTVEALESLLARGRRALRARLASVAPELLGEG